MYQERSIWWPTKSINPSQRKPWHNQQNQADNLPHDNARILPQNQEPFKYSQHWTEKPQSQKKRSNFGRKKTKPEKEEAEEIERDEGVKAEWSEPAEICGLGLALSEREDAVLEPVRSESEAEGVLKLFAL